MRAISPPLETMHMDKRAFRNLGAIKRADHLIDADSAPVRRKVRDLDRLIVGARHLPLACPVRAQLGFAAEPGAAVRPIHVLAHQSKQGIAVLSVVGRVSRQQPLFGSSVGPCRGRRISLSWTQATTLGIFSQ